MLKQSINHKPEWNLILELFKTKKYKTRIIVAFVNRPLSMNETDWADQMTEIASDGGIVLFLNLTFWS